MRNRFPPAKRGNRILIICEGDEEYDYLKRLKSCQVWDQCICVELRNAQSIDNIAALYSYHYKNGAYKLILAFCDTEKYPYAQFLSLKKKINALYDTSKASESVVFFSNPCTMQIVLSHFAEVALTSNQKADNAQLIKKLVGIDEYRATEKQRSSIMCKITAENYATMKRNISSLSQIYDVVPSSNALTLFRALDQEDKAWMRKTIAKLEKHQ